MKVILYGDSHCRMFFRDRPDYVKDNIEILNKYKSKVSLRGLKNNSSTTNMRNIMMNELELPENKEEIDMVGLKFGQVDMEYIYFYKKFVKCENIDIETFINELIEIYISVINEIRELGYSVFVVSTNLPIKTTYLKVIQNSIKKIIDVDYDELCMNICLFNNKLKHILNTENIPFLDLIPSIGFKKEEYYVLKSEYYGLDHHVKGGEHISKLNLKPSEYGRNENKYFMSLLVDYIKSL